MATCSQDHRIQNKTNGLERQFNQNEIGFVQLTNNSMFWFQFQSTSVGMLEMAGKRVEKTTKKRDVNIQVESDKDSEGSLPEGEVVVSCTTERGRGNGGEYIPISRLHLQFFTVSWRTRNHDNFEVMILCAIQRYVKLGTWSLQFQNYKIFSWCSASFWAYWTCKSQKAVQRSCALIFSPTASTWNFLRVPLEQPREKINQLSVSLQISQSWHLQMSVIDQRHRKFLILNSLLTCYKSNWLWTLFNAFPFNSRGRASQTKKFF